MATELTYLNLKNVTLYMRSGLVVDCTNIAVKRNPIYADRSPGMAWAKRRVRNGEDFPEITIEGFNSDDLSFSDIIPGDPVESFVLNDENGVTVLQSDFLGLWPLAGWVFGSPDTAFSGEDCSKWRVPLDAGVDNPRQ